ncbi:hypothetical protein TNCT_276041 [Trichonephila clavata]|uniref:Uncharacterized protein n=1 Tax=Trichonephila clavata TaxID=2740835 RepID=A0A8X6JMG1_TRICU|nr:hypothetical protein TNCT_276041 [Trichonephila clavata]
MAFFEWLQGIMESLLPQESFRMNHRNRFFPNLRDIFRRTVYQENSLAISLRSQSVYYNLASNISIPLDEVPLKRELDVLLNEDESTE